RILIHAGASGVGTAAIQLAKTTGCYVVATVGTEGKTKSCLALGADAVINYKNTDFGQWSKEHVPNGYDIILDVVAGDYVTKNIKVSAFDGHIVILAMLAGRYSEPVDVAILLSKRLTISASTLRNRDELYKENLVSSFTRDFYQYLKNEKVIPVIDSCYSWQQAEQAHTKMLKNNNIGKLILTVD
ncbi:MAG: zinc-binding dehydrogenase, partial [Alteromonadales bacterium]|nr:zinc-binding dehydrogenase [Alteromonadales bacterium]